MYTDMVGYTALGQRNESLSIALVDEQRKLIRPILTRHNGREIKTMGDAFLVEFLSALDAVRCAYDIQRATREFNLAVPEDRRIHLRVGVHLGDVVESGGDISGDAVNLASRIEELADDGGVCLTRQVYDHVQNKFELPMVSLGIKMLKNVSVPIEVFKIVMPWAQEILPTVKLDKRRIAVLPFSNISPDPADEYFADGMTEELISTTSSITGLNLIARTSVMRYKGTTKGIEEIGRELSVGTVLEGSVRKAGNRLRITVQLIDVQSQGHLWAQSYDRDFDDVFAIQSDIAKTVADALKVRMLPSETRQIEKRPTSNAEAHILYLKGRNYQNERTHDGFQKAIRYFEEAIKRDPSYASPYSGLSDCYRLLENWGFMRPKDAWAKAKEYAKKALVADNALAEAHTSMALSLAHADWDWEAAEREFKLALHINPSYANARHWYAIGLLFPERRWEDAIKEIGEAAKLDPFSSIIGTSRGRILFAAGRRTEGVGQFRQVLEMNPEFAFAHSSLGAALVSMNSIEEGITEIRKALELSPENSWTRAELAFAYIAGRRKMDAQRILQELKEISNKRYVPNTVVAGVYAVLNERDRAFEWLDRAVEERTTTIPEYVNEPVFDGIRTDPRFHKLLQAIGLAVWHDTELGKKREGTTPVQG